ncbi:FecR family protein [Pedobacter ghigonis]|uniref:FecR family protein n=1 Tax=Pedobacter ghigonis TaxID=2730403 RepID=UPI001588EA97|nr:FecR domain-containing protein [Pedobacter ghigonis]
MDQHYAKQLLEKYKSGNCSQFEKEQVERWIDFGEFPEFTLSEKELQNQMNALSSALPLHREKRLWPRLSIAAALAFIVISIGISYYKTNTPPARKETATVKNIVPGKTGATLTLANGQKIKLSDAINGEIAKETGVSITKMQNGELAYQFAPTANGSAKKNSINTLSTARGETYLLILPDKSKVWLNAASSITYSTNLIDKGIRRVQLKGEAYFEVFKDKSHPFVVSTANQEVEVLGTHFNINSYADEPATTTTLLEGSVKVKQGSVSHLLKPDQQAALDKGGKFTLSNVNADDAVAWKDGVFLFEDEPLESIMRRISRWYNLDIEYAKDVDKDKLYSGGVSRYENVSTVLEILESTKNIHLKIEERRIIVMK